MSLVYMGTALVAGGFAAFGISFALRLRRRLRTITALVGAIDYIEAEISYGLTSLPELMLELAGRDGILGDFWISVSPGREKNGKFSEIWIKNAGELDLKEQDRLLVEEIGRILGKYDAERQASRLGFIKKKLEYSQASAREELIKNGRLFCTLGVLGGLMIAIILL